MVLGCGYSYIYGMSFLAAAVDSALIWLIYCTCIFFIPFICAGLLDIINIDAGEFSPGLLFLTHDYMWKKTMNLIHESLSYLITFTCQSVFYSKKIAPTA